MNEASVKQKGVARVFPSEDAIQRFFAYIPLTARGHTVAVIGELVGTISFLFFAFAGTQVANISSNTNTGTTVITTVAQKNPSELLYISLAFGFSLAVNAWVFFRVSGGLFNPAVSPCLWVNFEGLPLAVVRFMMPFSYMGPML
jgi:glycerol uptake facilitator-like aquaporin